MNKKEAKEEVQKLIRKYESLNSREKKEYNEAMTRKDFIMPLFAALGWDVYNNFIHNEVLEEESAVKGTVDYSFRLNNIPQFLLEAKGIKIDLDKSEWAKQAISYGWNMGIEWVILSDFEGLKLFNANWKVEIPHSNLEFTYKEYLTRFDDLWFFSKESFQKGDLDKQTEKWGIRTKRVEVDEKLAIHLIEWRKELFENLSQWNAKKSESEIDEAVQRILDRFIFIRSCEDRKIEPPTLWPAFQSWQKNIMKYPNFLETLKPIFKKFDKKYNSNLFLPHYCEELDTEGEPFLKVVGELYGNVESGVKYNFAVIKPDVLGKVYEQYLGHLLQKAGKKGEDLGKTKRKKHGIYYTPTFIVDYIVQNAFGPVLDRCKTIHDLKKIKILDPACGSGSFLVRAIELINDKYKKLGAEGDGFTKIQILTDNIYGVDLDEQAVEITRLNLLLSVLDEQIKLPLLSNNIKNGNSLISGTDEELRRYFGKNFKNKKPFNWEEEFPEVFRQGGFDVIIGNPPYVSYYSRESAKSDEIDKELKMFREKFDFTKYQKKTGRLNLWMFFVENFIKLLRKEGMLAFIVDVNFTKDVSRDIRRYIIENTSLKQLVHDLSEFGQVASGQVILVVKKEKNNLENDILIKENLNEKGIKLRQSKIKGPDFDLVSVSDDPIISKFSAISCLKNIRGLKLTTGVQIGGVELYKGKKVKDYFYQLKWDCKKTFPSVETKTIQRYSRPKSERGILFDYKLASEITKNTKKSAIVLSKYKEFLYKEKIFIRQSASVIIATIGEPKTCAEYSVFSLISNSRNLNLKYILALLNSKLFSYYSIKKGIILAKKGTQPQIRKAGLEKLPIKQIIITEQKIFISLANKMLKLNEELEKTIENSDKWNSIKSEIEKTDKKIDNEVYNLYGLTPAEIKIVEEQSKN